jgi:hypothetical protein
VSTKGRVARREEKGARGGGSGKVLLKKVTVQGEIANLSAGVSE